MTTIITNRIEIKVYQYKRSWGLLECYLSICVLNGRSLSQKYLPKSKSKYIIVVKATEMMVESLYWKDKFTYGHLHTCVEMSVEMD